ncbi:MAG: arylsulfatase [Bacteroidota bacterium]
MILAPKHYSEGAFRSYFDAICSLVVALLGGLICSLTSCVSTEISEDTRPNIVLIMVDDMGFSDIGSYGGEIPTPNIDRLATEGIRFSQFYNTARCCPTRASLLTGLFPHQTGIGHMTNPPKNAHRYDDWGTEGYQGYLNRNCVTIAEVLAENGYHTYMAGKWHLGYHDTTRWPLQRGFEKFYGSIAGATSYFWPNGDRPVTYMNQHLPPPDSNTYYTTDAFTEYGIRFIEEQEENRPFFLYLAYTAPHWPLHAKEEDIRKFVGKYTGGWDEVRQNRFQRQQEIGLFQNSFPISERDSRVRSWSEVDEAQKQESDYRMAVYAAQVYAVDYNIGKLLDHLEESDKMDNTLILFLSDNGACAEMYDEFGSKPISWINRATFSGAVSYGIGWANTSNTPFYEYKVQTYEGGISTPLIAHWPTKINNAGTINHNPGYLIDVMPTILEVSQSAYPSEYHNGNKIHALEGKSLVPVFETGSRNTHEYMYWEHQDNCAIRKGDWKAVKKLADKQWQLYDLSKDRAEVNNLASEHPELVSELDQAWKKWANSHHVLPKKIKK